MKKLQALFCALLVCTLLLSGLPRTASAAYPDRPVTIIIPVSYTHLTLPTIA